MFRRFAVVFMLAGLASGGGCRRDSGDTLPPSEPIRAEELRQTEVFPHPEGPIVAGKNYVYCATFQLAWNEFQDKIVGEPVHLAGLPPMGEDLLRGSKLTVDILPPGTYLVKAGLIKDGVVGELRESMSRLFPNATLRIPERLEDQEAIAYAYMQASFKFREAFDRLDDPLVFKPRTGPVKVACFGIQNFKSDSRRDEALGKQVSVLADASDDEFVLRLNTTSASDEMVLAKVKPRETLISTLAAVRKLIERRMGEDGPTGLSPGDSLVVPLIDLNVLRKYTELEGRSPTNPKLSKIYLAIAEQTIRFRLDEKGARLESNAYEGWKSAAGREKPAQYIFDKPFLIYLKRTSSDYPYLAIWIETPELLQSVEKLDHME
ncbi:MAG: hypothetical protein ABSA26_04665 [Thermoguttaceae bacterium]|jgi:hypothetical protein